MRLAIIVESFDGCRLRLSAPRNAVRRGGYRVRQRHVPGSRRSYVSSVRVADCIRGHSTYRRLRKATHVRPAASSASVQSRMSRQRRRDTQPELLVRRILHSRGIRYRVNSVPVLGLRTRADLVWKGLRLAVFIDGCFWHGCPEHATRPKANEAWWAEKLDTNVQRDRRTDRELTSRGWTVLRFWEHEQPETAADAICATLSELRARKRSVQSSATDT